MLTGRDGSKTFLMAGQPMDIKFEKIQRKMPLSQQFPGAHLTGIFLLRYFFLSLSSNFSLSL